VFTIPLLLGNLFQQVYAFTDAAVVGQFLGLSGLAAVGATASIMFLLVGFTWGAGSGLAIPVARAFGAGDHRTVRATAAAGLYASVAMALIITVVGMLSARTALTLMNTPAEVLDDATAYLVVICAGQMAAVAFNYLASTMRALGDSRTPLIFLIASSVLNALLVILFVGVWHQGLAGAAATTIIGHGAAAVGCVIYIKKRMPLLHLTLDDLRAGLGHVKEVLATGLPMGFHVSIIALGAMVLQVAINNLGADAVAATTAAMRLDGLAVAPLASIGVAMVTFVAQNRGAQQWERIRIGVFRMALVVTGLSITLSVIILVFSRQLATVFIGSHNPHVVDMAQTYLLIAAGLYGLLGLKFVYRSALQGMGHAVVATASGVVEMVARTVVGFTLVASLGIVGVALAAPIAWGAALTLVAVRWRMELPRLRLLEAGEEPAISQSVPAAHLGPAVTPVFDDSARESSERHALALG
jgi:putative MATE family efflux protein